MLVFDPELGLIEIVKKGFDLLVAECRELSQVGQGHPVQAAEGVDSTKKPDYRKVAPIAQHARSPGVPEFLADSARVRFT